MIDNLLTKVSNIKAKYPNINFNINKKYLNIVISGNDNGGAKRVSEQKIDIEYAFKSQDIITVALDKQIEHFNKEIME